MKTVEMGKSGSSLLYNPANCRGGAQGRMGKSIVFSQFDKEFLQTSCENSDLYNL